MSPHQGAVSREKGTKGHEDLLTSKDQIKLAIYRPLFAFRICVNVDWHANTLNRFNRRHKEFEQTSRVIWLQMVTLRILLTPHCILADFILVRLLSLSLCLTVNLLSRKIPGLNVYAQMQNEKEQEMMSPANPTEATPSSQRDLVHSLEILDTEFNSRPIGKYAL